MVTVRTLIIVEIQFNANYPKNRLMLSERKTMFFFMNHIGSNQSRYFSFHKTHYPVNP